MAEYDLEESSDTEAHRRDVVAALNDFEVALRARYERDLTHGLVVQGSTGLTMQYLSAQEPEAVPNSPINEWVNRDQTPGWSKRNASAVRADIEQVVPWYDTQNLKVLGVAFDNLVAAAESLGWADGGLTSYAPGTIAKLANDINSDGGTVGGTDEWTGPTSIAFKPFGKSVPKTVTHHCNIAASMTQLYAGRVCIIETIRSNTLEAIKAATNGLTATEDYTGTAGEWLAFNLAAVAVGAAAGPVGGILVGVGAAAASFRATENPVQVPANSIGGVINGLRGQLRSDTNITHDAEYDWAEKVQQLAREIVQLTRSELELHDFTKGDGGGTRQGTGFSVNTTHVTNLAGRCVKASEQYEEVIAAIIRTDSADAELNGLDGHVTWGDRELIDIRNTLVGFTKVTCARLHEAGTRLYETARQYDRTDDEAARKLQYEKFSDAPDLNGDGTGTGGSADDHLDGTDTGAIEDWDDLKNPDDRLNSPRQGR